MDEIPDYVLTIEELAACLKTPKSTLYKPVREGMLPSQRISRHWRFQKGPLTAGWRRRGRTIPTQEEIDNGAAGEMGRAIAVD